MALTSLFGAACNRPASGADHLPLPATTLPSEKTPAAGEKHTLIVAGGCFWCVEGVFQQLNGVISATSGYAGGSKETATYETVCTGVSHHAEAVRIVYDPSKISYGQLLQVFFTTHDPTTKNRQGPDSGTQYRSAIFTLDEDQKKVAEAYIAQLNEAKAFDKPVVTTVEPLKAEAFYPAEDYHQKYVVCHPNNPYVRQQALPKIEKVRSKFKDEVKPEENK